MPAIYEHAVEVQPSDIDALGHANNLVYLGWMQSAALAHSALQGWTTEKYLELGSGWVVRSHQITYLRPAMDGDAVVVRTWIAANRRATSVRKYVILRAADGVTLAEAETCWAFVNLASGMPQRIAPEVAAAFQVVPDEESGRAGASAPAASG